MRFAKLALISTVALAFAVPAFADSTPASPSATAGAASTDATKAPVKKMHQHHKKAGHTATTDSKSPSTPTAK